FHDELLHFGELYGCMGIRVAPKNFDCTIRFHCGIFGSWKLARRTFRRHRRNAGSYIPDGTVEPKHIDRLIAQDIVVSYTLDDNERIELWRNGTKFWSTDDPGIPNNVQVIQIEILADDTTTERFYCDSFAVGEEAYWLPNPGDPPPICSLPPCQDGA